jgi:hypothetical protein
VAPAKAKQLVVPIALHDVPKDVAVAVSYPSRLKLSIHFVHFAQSVGCDLAQLVTVFNLH